MTSGPKTRISDARAAMRRIFISLTLLGGVAACGDGGPSVSQFAAPRIIEVQSEPPAEAGRCWANAYTQSSAPGLSRGVGLWVETPCDTNLTPDFQASLQRALQARGLYAGPITGQMDAGTEAAIRAFQAPLGLDSPILSLAAAERLGLVAVKAARDRAAT